MSYIFKKYTRVEKIYAIVDAQVADAVENAEMKSKVDDIYHHTLLDMVLDELDEDKKVHVLANINEDITHDSLLMDLNEWIHDFEAKITHLVEQTERELLELLKS